MDKRLLALPLLLLAGSSLSGCVAAAIPALAGAGIFGTRIDGKEPGENKATAEEVAAAVPAPAPKPAPAPAIPQPQPQPQPAPSIAVATPPPATATAAVSAAAPAAVPPPAAYPDPDRPLKPDQLSFARFVRYGQASAQGARNGASLPSAMLSDPVELDGKRRRCSPGEQLVALIDLDPAGGVFAPPAKPAQQPGLALGLAVLREAGVEIAWLSDMSTTLSGQLRTVLEQSGLDPRGEDIISLRRDEADTKAQRRDSLAAITCVIAIAGDERPDFDTRFKYLRSPEAGAGLEPLIGDGWFLITPLLANEGS